MSTTKTAVNSIEIPNEFVSLCQDWHAGQDTMLYAIASTGNLTTGTARPLDCDTDEAWYARLWRNLDIELTATLKGAHRYHDDDHDVPVLDRFQHYAEQTADRLEQEYAL